MDSTEFVAEQQNSYGPKQEIIKVSVLHKGANKYVCTVCGAEKTEEIPSPVFGDVDGDQSVSPADARKALRAAVGLETLTELQTIAGDINHSDGIDLFDARYILRIAIKLDNAKDLLKRFYQ